MGIKNFLKKLKLFLYTCIIIKNWHIPIIRYLSNKEKIEIIKFRTNLKCLIRNKSDAIAFFEIFILKSNNILKSFKIKETDIIIDIGAHVGYFTLFAGEKAKKGKIYSFEPFNKSFEILKKNIEINQFQNIVIENVAVMKESGTSTLYVNEKAIGNNMFEKTSESSINVQTISIKDIFKKYDLIKIDFLKIDCEGAEFEIILNCDQKDLKKINKIVAEIHPNIQNFKIGDIVEFLEINNFSVQIIHPLSGRVENLPMLYAQNKKM